MKSIRRMSVVGGIIFSVVVMTSWNTTWAQFGGAGGFSSAGAIGIDTIYNQSIIAVVSSDKKTISAYSAKTGKWIAQKLNPEKDEIISPLLLENSILVQSGRNMYIFDGRSGKWRTADTGLESGDWATMLSTKRICIGYSNSKLFAYSDLKGIWATVELKPGSEVEAQPIYFAGNMVIAKVNKKRLYVFSALTGTWDSVLYPLEKQDSPAVKE